MRARRKPGPAPSHDVELIRRLRPRTRVSTLARRFGISRSHVSRLCAGIEGPDDRRWNGGHRRPTVARFCPDGLRPMYDRVRKEHGASRARAMIRDLVAKGITVEAPRIPPGVYWAIATQVRALKDDAGLSFRAIGGRIGVEASTAHRAYHEGTRHG